MSRKKVMITQSNYIPWKGYIDAIRSMDEVILYDDMQYTKRDWRNRNQIKTPQGLQWLSIPVEVKGKFNQKICETRVSEPGWRSDHWKAIRFNYSKAPYFSEYAPLFERAYLESEETYLSKINLSFLEIVCGILCIRTPMRFSSEFTLAEGKTERLVDLCRQLGATDYYSGPKSKDYMDEALFQSAGIRVHYFDFSGYPVYPQLHGEFAHGVSAVDLIFNTGPRALQYLKGFDLEGPSVAMQEALVGSQ